MSQRKRQTQYKPKPLIGNGTLVKKIVLCATPRSGSTMICADMAATGVLGNPREHFINWAPSRQDIDWKERLNTTIKNQTKKKFFLLKLCHLK
ncbi:Stf0 family sulfotransferase [Eilatimonas milleporae]|uniref:Stf0 family sulfotransferase n=1 Tax=Eilatimonas milleporae TaxID=911205 RepID=UPI003CCC830A